MISPQRYLRMGQLFQLPHAVCSLTDDLEEVKDSELEHPVGFQIFPLPVRGKLINLECMVAHVAENDHHAAT